jgi:hypothetical protein
MMEPPVTNSPAKAFTPSRCAFESRPFVELPPPFLCAIAESPSQKLLSAMSVQLLACSMQKPEPALNARQTPVNCAYLAA